MPIDFLGRKRDLEQGANSMLASQYDAIPNQNQTMLDSINQGRADFSGKLNLPSELLAMKAPILSRRAQGVVDTLGYSRQNDLLQQRFAELFRQAQDAGMDNQSAQEYARKQASLTKAQDFAASQSDAERQAQERLFQMKSDYTNQGIQMQNMFNDQQIANDRSGALARLLAGSAGAIGTAYVQSHPDAIGNFFKSAFATKSKPNVVGANGAAPKGYE